MRLKGIKEQRSYCPKCDTYKFYKHNKHCNVCGTKLKVPER